MSFEELSSRLGGLPDNENLNVMKEHPFSEVPSSARISMCTSIESGGDGKHPSFDFANIPALLEPLDESAGHAEQHPLATFAYENRFFNHFNVN